MTIPSLPQSCPVGKAKICNGASQLPLGHGLEQIAANRVVLARWSMGHVSMQFHGIKQLRNRQFFLLSGRIYPLRHYNVNGHNFNF